MIIQTKNQVVADVLEETYYIYFYQYQYKCDIDPTTNRLTASSTSSTMNTKVEKRIPAKNPWLFMTTTGIIRKPAFTRWA